MPLLSCLGTRFPRTKKYPKSPRPQFRTKSFIDLNHSLKFLRNRLEKERFEFSGDDLLKLWECCLHLQLNPVDLPEEEDNRILNYGISELERKLAAGEEAVVVWDKWLELVKSALPVADNNYRKKIGRKDVIVKW